MNKLFVVIIAAFALVGCDRVYQAIDTVPSAWVLMSEFGNEAPAQSVKHPIFNNRQICLNAVFEIMGAPEMNFKPEEKVTVTNKSIPHGLQITVVDLTTNQVTVIKMYCKSI